MTQPELEPAADQAPGPGAGQGAASTACAVVLPTFEGPLDLLLHLIRANEVDISDIPIALITEQYLEYLDLMRRLDIDVAAEYLVMAATLAHIKSRMLLPADPDDEEGEGADPRAELARRLAEYAVFRDAAAELGTRPLLGRDVFGGAPHADDAPEPEPVLEVSAFALLEALRAVLARIPPESQHHQVYREPLTVRDRMLYVLDALRGAVGAALRFEDVLVAGGVTRQRVVVTFLALLELAKVQAVRLFQSVDDAGVPCGPIRVRLAVDPGDELEEPD